MARQFVLPDLGEGLTEAEIVQVLVSEGDVVGEDAPLLEVETDKARSRFPPRSAGAWTRSTSSRGRRVKVGRGAR